MVGEGQALRFFDLDHLPAPISPRVLHYIRQAIDSA
ncbi:hypothetical protein HNR23_004912 [Nocardiopsis mwathae]|uniref:Uncharacterized protein n=1 Tax=Nocardiopsis mwathae TaxID=1472723 RepID=A0A7W9YMF7_9ACTN|nr:hypothetical protein [Nocardiopsis mwathae]